MAGSKKEFLVVAAIDFGTTYSGYAFSFRSDFKKDPLKVSSNEQWENGGDGTFKTPTSILFDEHQRFHSFGYAAEKKYASLASSEEDDENSESDDENPKESHRDWFYFRRFKMTLFRAISQGGRPRGKRITKDMKLTAENGNKMPAVKVFSEAIRFLKEHLDKTLAKRLETRDESGKSLQQTSWADDIRWVLTVPAIWSNEAKQFMRVAAEQAGIKGNQLMLALEPEAAAMFCKQLALSKTGDLEVSTYQPGKKFVVVDCGGGTVDVTAHQVMAGGLLQELHCATGDAIGGTNVDRMFFGALNQWFGAEVMKQFKQDNASDMLELERSFESKKRGIGRDGAEDNITFSNLGELCKIHKEQTDVSVKSKISELNLNKKVTVFKENKIRFQSGYLRELVFDGAINAIVSHLEGLFLNPSVSDIDTVLLVGGFSDCPILQQKIRDSFPTRIIVNPPEANLAVLKGAVIFGHHPESVSQRLSPRYYGIAINVPFERQKHPENHLMHIGEDEVCTDVFKCLIEKNAPLTRIQKTFTTSTEYTRQANIEIYEASSHVTYCDDSDCRMLGSVVVEISDMMGNDKREIDVCLEFGSTELFVVAQDKVTKRTEKAQFECLKK